MKNLIIIILFLIFSSLNAQTSKEIRVKTTPQNKEAMVKTATLTIYTYKGNPVYKRGNRYFALIKSRNNNYYTKTVEIAK